MKQKEAALLLFLCVVLCTFLSFVFVVPQVAAVRYGTRPTATVQSFWQRLAQEAPLRGPLIESLLSGAANPTKCPVHRGLRIAPSETWESEV